jgi:uncharacterized protein
VSVIEISTAHGPARALLDEAESPAAALVLGHGAGGGVEAPDLVVATEVALSERISVARVEQPYLVAGKRSQPAASTVDSAWIAAVEYLRAGPLADLPLIAGGRSAGARIACRTVAETGAFAVLCLAFPLQPPPRRNGKESPSRLDELEAVDVPVLVVQGDRDRFGMPPDGPKRTVTVVPGDHGLKADRDAIAEAVRGWLRTGTIVPA